MTKVKWEELGEMPTSTLYRIKVPGGWLVRIQGHSGSEAITFYPDPQHLWNGSPLP